MSYYVQFKVICQTTYGQQVLICGNIPQLGCWNPAEALRMQTFPRMYPLWVASHPIQVKQNQIIEFKLCILNAKNELVRWQDISSNRVLLPKQSIIIEFTESNPKLTPRESRRKVDRESELCLVNVRKGTEQILNELQSDSSSNRDILQDNQEEEEEGSLLLMQFSAELVKLASQEEKSLTYHPELIDNFGAYTTHNVNSHYFVVPTSNTLSYPLYSKQQTQTWDWINQSNLSTYHIYFHDQISVFHFQQWEEKEIVGTVTAVKEHWLELTDHYPKGIMVIYLKQDLSLETLIALEHQGVSVFVTSLETYACHTLDLLEKIGYTVKNVACDEFMAHKDRNHQIKVIITPSECLTSKQALVQHLRHPILSGFYFAFNDKEFKRCLNQELIMSSAINTHYLILLQINHVDQLQSHIISELVYLSSCRNKVTLFVITHQRFPKNMSIRIPVHNSRMVFINTHGEIYVNHVDPLSIYGYLNLNPQKFIQNQNIVVQSLGKGSSIQRKEEECKTIIQLPKSAMGKALKTRVKQIVNHINKKTLAKLVIDQRNNNLELIPYCLHLQFLYKVILGTFAGTLHNYNKGMVINIDGANLVSRPYLQVTESQKKLAFLCFHLTSEAHFNYACPHINQVQLRKLVNELSKSSQQNQRRIPVLQNIRNIR